MSREQRTPKRKLCNFLLCPIANKTCLCLQPFFFPPVQRHTPLFSSNTILQSLNWFMSLPTFLRSYSTNYFFPLYPSHSSDSLPFSWSLFQPKTITFSWIPIIPVTTLHPFPPLMDFAKGSIYLLDSCFAPLTNDNSTFILPRKTWSRRFLNTEMVTSVTK